LYHPAPAPRLTKSTEFSFNLITELKKKKHEENKPEQTRPLYKHKICRHRSPTNTEDKHRIKTKQQKASDSPELLTGLTCAG
jgi:hypothetical protein